MAHPVLTPTSPTKAAHRSPWHRMPFRLSSTSSSGMRLRSSSFSIVNRGQSLEYEQQAPQELQASIGRHACDLWRHTVYREPQFGGAVALDQVAATAFEVRNAASACSRCTWLLLWMAMVRPSLRGERRWRSLLCFLLPLRPLEHPRTARVLSARRS